MTVVNIVQTRHAVKAFRPDRQLKPEQITALKTAMRFSPSSINSQPWHFILAVTDEGKSLISQATGDEYPFNTPKILNASLVVALCARKDLPESYLQTILQQEEADGRFPTPEARAMQDKNRHYYVDLHRYKNNDMPAWIQHQVYLALGGLLMAAAVEEIDACPIEGFNSGRLDQVLGLEDKGLTSVVLVALGTRSDEDFNAALPKSRLPEDVVFSEI